MPEYTVVEEQYDEFYLVIDQEKERPQTIWNIYDENGIQMEGFESEEEAKQMAELILVGDEIEEDLRRAIKLVMKRALNRFKGRQDDFFLVDDPVSTMLDWLESFFDGLGSGLGSGHLRCILEMERGSSVGL